ncbi:MAG: 4-hydroxy-tetrahydrodipicolinate reductase [Methanocalculus sp. MSAO_Arc1]|uniref:4-hydroxy-tetrahydrodipicolinate reductase n=1 Tax=Methanocalculus TaxID=71151 RepID=UPI000FEFE349|nr:MULTISPECIES: 4-hydroxy-tetrahydrodipicolinate reductase [unclassified Methanocalculus]MCP1661773.1 4-hydroxy-tetrahydrodipicolinate reductase [Methanocalculus sp. AMF5]RQD79432.1 MAG: 4-hydroxy-tetrahydrodipicolinate reductase [Methanocalculus sp. MSAO_Arc1]
MINVAVCGAFGRMGTIIGDMINNDPDLAYAGGIDLRSGELFGKPVVEAADLDSFLKTVKPDCLIDFTIASASVTNIEIAARNKTALVVGTTGFNDEEEMRIRKATEGVVPIVKTTNFSVGVNIFWQLIRNAATLLNDYDCEVIEAHHRYKKDAPSGTARTILEILEEEMGAREKQYGRVGMTERGSEIGVHVIRGGDIVGDHKVLFSGNFETIELSHRAYDRSVFARGALRAAKWVSEQPAGMYTMKDVLGLAD